MKRSKLIDLCFPIHTNAELSYYNAACLARVNIVSENLLNSKTIELHQLSSVHEHDLTTMALWKKKNKRVWKKKNKEREKVLYVLLLLQSWCNVEWNWKHKKLFIASLLHDMHSSVRCVDKSDDSLWEFFSSFFCTTQCIFIQ